MIHTIFDGRKLEYVMSKWLSILFLLLFASSCSFLGGEKCISFDEVSRTYLDRYGEPEETRAYTSENYKSVDWWWWSKGFMVSFVSTDYDDICGWTIDLTYSFEPK